MVGGDLNGHVGKLQSAFDREHGGYGCGQRNEEGKCILEVAQSMDLFCANTGFRKKDQHLVTYSSGGRNTQIDYFLVRQSERGQIRNCTVINGEAIASQHRVLMMDMKWNIKVQNKRKKGFQSPPKKKSPNRGKERIFFKLVLLSFDSPRN